MIPILNKFTITLSIIIIIIGVIYDRRKSYLENKQREEELTIKFNDEYPKLHKQQTAVLIDVKLLEDNELTIELIEYDCIKSNGEFYALPPGTLIQLIFLGDKGIPFCTLRSYTSDKLLDYSNKKGKEFKLLRVD